MADANRYTLDTSAFIAYLSDEPGAGLVQTLLMRAESRQVELFASFMSYMETLYRVWRQNGEKEGKLAYLRLKALGVKRVDQSEGLLLRAARVKAEFDLSVADAWIAATALITESRLVHKDPEFRPLGSRMGLVELPLKPRRSKEKKQRTDTKRSG